MAAETTMGREWRLRLEASKQHRAGHIHDPQVPGLYWSPAAHAKAGSR